MAPPGYNCACYASLGCLMRSLTLPGLVPIDGAVVAVLGSSLAFLCR